MMNERFRAFVKSALGCIIALNVLSFIIIGILGLTAFHGLAYTFALAGPFNEVIFQPWGVITYMFCHADFLHLLFNMMWLLAFGMVLVRMGREKAVWPVYLVSGISGALFFLSTSQLAGLHLCFLIGSSAAVLGIITAAAVYFPNLKVNLFLFGEVRLVWVALVALVLCGVAPGLESLPTLLAHLGGIAGGGIYALTGPRLKSPKRKSKIVNTRLQEKRGLTSAEQKQLDELLDKVRTSGYKSLGMKERSRLFTLSNKINR